ncbi:MAG: hypothetical protein PVJ03_02130 [Chromatiaceae bacterium]
MASSRTPPCIGYRNVALRRPAGHELGALCRQKLRRENAVFRGTGGVSEDNRSLGFRPAYFNTATGETVVSRFANGAIAPVHVLDGLPEDWVVARDRRGNVREVLASILAGFVRGGRFYTREAAARIAGGGD